MPHALPFLGFLVGTLLVAQAPLPAWEAAQAEMWVLVGQREALLRADRKDAAERLAAPIQTLLDQPFTLPYAVDLGPYDAARKVLTVRLRPPYEAEFRFLGDLRAEPATAQDLVSRKAQLSASASATVGQGLLLPTELQDPRLGRLPLTGVRAVTGRLAVVLARALVSGNEDLVRRYRALPPVQGEAPPAAEVLRLLEALAQDQVAKGRLAQAEDSFALIGRYLPMEPSIWENLGLLQARMARSEASLGSYARARSLHGSTQLSFNLGLAFMQLGRYGEAEEHWQAVLAGPKTDPSLDLKAKRLYAASLLMGGRAKEALEVMAPWPELATNGSLAAMRIQALMRTGDWDAAGRLLREGMGQFPEEGLFHLAAMTPYLPMDIDARTLVWADRAAMAELRRDFQVWEPCLAAVREARRDAPLRLLRLLILEAQALEQLGRPQEAMALYREGLKTYPTQPFLRAALGSLLLDQGGAQEEAAQHLQAALAKEPGNLRALEAWGRVLRLQGKLAASEAALRKAAALSPFSPGIHHQLAETLLAQERPAEALEEWERALGYVHPERAEIERRVVELRDRLAVVP